MTQISDDAMLSAEESKYLQEYINDQLQEKAPVITKRIYPKQLVPILRALAADTIKAQVQFGTQSPEYLQQEDVLLMPDPVYLGWHMEFTTVLSERTTAGLLDDSGILLWQMFNMDKEQNCMWMLLKFYLLNCENDVCPLDPFGRKYILTSFPVSPRLLKALFSWHRRVVSQEDYRRINNQQLDGTSADCWQFGGHVPYQRPYFPYQFYRLFSNRKDMEHVVRFFDPENFLPTKKYIRAIMNIHASGEFLDVETSHLALDTLSSTFDGRYYALLPGVEEPKRAGGPIIVH